MVAPSLCIMHKEGATNNYGSLLLFGRKGEDAHHAFFKTRGIVHLDQIAEEGRGTAYKVRNISCWLKNSLKPRSRQRARNKLSSGSLKT